MACARAKGSGRGVLQLEEKARLSSVGGTGGLLRQRDEVTVMAASGAIARASLL
jgi:hypothetical protein